MKLVNKYIVIIFGLLAFSSCDRSYDLSEELGPQELPGYVAFNAEGNDITIDAEDVSEDGGEVDFNVENPTGTLSDITVNYEFGGTAIFGQDFTIEGASASGGSLTIKHEPTDIQFRDNEDIVVKLLMDNMIDGDKTLEIILVSASNAEGVLAVGRGGTDFLKTAIINISDVDCALEDLTGAYDFTIAGDLGSSSGVIAITQGADGTWVLDDFAAGAFGDPVPYEISVAPNGEVTAPAASMVSDGVEATITGVVNTCTNSMLLNVTLNCCGAEGFIWTLTLTPQ
ncbi:MAG: hypothetical protein V3V00_01600 [Saprospiraceae bacterium]